MMFADAFAGIAAGFSQAFDGPFHPAVARWSGTPVYDDGGSIIVPGVPIARDCLCQVDVVTDAMRGDVGFVAGDVRLLVLAASLEGALDTDATVQVSAGPGQGVYSIQAVARDPVGVAWDARGRRV